jgi:tryptophan synthase alpha subunit
MVMNLSGRGDKEGRRLRALHAGATLAGTLEMVAGSASVDDETPMILMGYLQSDLCLRTERFCKDAAAWPASMA